MSRTLRRITYIPKIDTAELFFTAAYHLHSTGRTKSYIPSMELWRLFVIS
jgi:hypothetical protein